VAFEIQRARFANGVRDVVLCKLNHTTIRGEAKAELTRHASKGIDRTRWFKKDTADLMFRSTDRRRIVRSGSTVLFCQFDDSSNARTQSYPTGKLNLQIARVRLPPAVALSRRTPTPSRRHCGSGNQTRQSTNGATDQRNPLNSD